MQNLDIIVSTESVILKFIFGGGGLQIWERKSLRTCRE